MAGQRQPLAPRQGRGQGSPYQYIEVTLSPPHIEEPYVDVLRWRGCVRVGWWLVFRFLSRRHLRVCGAGLYASLVWRAGSCHLPHQCPSLMLTPFSRNVLLFSLGSYRKQPSSCDQRVLVNTAHHFSPHYLSLMLINNPFPALFSWVVVINRAIEAIKILAAISVHTSRGTAV